MWMSIRQLSRLSGISEKRIRAYILNGMRYYQESPTGQASMASMMDSNLQINLHQNYISGKKAIANDN